ncbi:MAG: GIY-YIG nuclease family protein [Chlamydiota bacterium]|nr:GIY-YIG nuclease family protein [Chlamydiota bacterium]
MKQFYLYIMASKPNGTLYVGITNNLVRRVYEHKHDMIDGFTKKYQVHQLVCYECYPSSVEAISREKCVKRWKRSWKTKLIEEKNPAWDDLYCKIIR